ncbi:hypothetical protein C8F04DRAFT_1243594 [Mycena alexandri]|uniref:Uncharacterized protein n=1 Tax=Mycena alexandri TaxID=1745969 RepID=A0AAD6RZH7_9AGAR|nr:hypothetical protein C8F04DRAFT_1243594 [Mycena alexandri]
MLFLPPHLTSHRSPTLTVKLLMEPQNWYSMTSQLLREQSPSHWQSGYAEFLSLLHAAAAHLHKLLDCLSLYAYSPDFLPDSLDLHNMTMALRSLVSCSTQSPASGATSTPCTFDTILISVLQACANQDNEWEPWEPWELMQDWSFRHIQMSQDLQYVDRVGVPVRPSCHWPASMFVIPDHAHVLLQRLVYIVDYA